MNASKYAIGILVAVVPFAVGVGSVHAQSTPGAPTNYNTLPYSTSSMGEAHHSSTLSEGVRRGYGFAQMGNAQVIAAQGVAAESFAQADHQALNDWLVWVDRKVQLRQQMLADQAEELSRRRTNAPEVSELAVKCLPQRLGVSQLGPDGALDWPDVLLTDDYRQSRQVLDQLFHDRSYGGTVQTQHAIRNAIEIHAAKLLGQLKSRINNYHNADYISAKKFVQGLQVEAVSGNPIVLTSSDRTN
jgi:hypothetical protein